jgi:type II secretory ATPase GspE/PulE/Tfp pilus assembly ATPase PilB-like protein
MVGEIRDRETLEMAMESAMTGHLVFSTIHTNSAVETITRVLNMGAQSFMLAGTFNLVIAQRLGRRVCPHCAAKISMKDDAKYQYAKQTFQHFDKEILKKEILARGITQEEWTDFFTNGYITQGTGKDPKT